MTDFVCIGDVTQDNFFFIDEASVHCDINKENCTLELKYGQKVPVSRFGVVCGGNAANVATGLAKLGIKPELLTTFGGDERGAWLKRQLLSNNVGLENSIVDAKRESNISSLIIFKGERTILTYHAQGEDLVNKIPPAKWIYLSSSAGRDSTKIHQLVLEQKGEAKLALNPSVGDLRQGREFLQPILAVCDVLIVNREEAEMLTGQSFGSASQGLSVSAQDKQDSKMAGEEMAKLGPKIVVVTDGMNGANVFDGQKTSHFEPIPSEILETTGAGDAFSSGFLAGLFAGESIDAAMLWGMKNASSVVTKLGAQEGLLTLEQVKL